MLFVREQVTYLVCVWCCWRVCVACRWEGCIIGVIGWLEKRGLELFIKPILRLSSLL